jgi:hypothetical protein
MWGLLAIKGKEKEQDYYKSKRIAISIENIPKAISSRKDLS